jgi:hypothetical protein
MHANNRKADAAPRRFGNIRDNDNTMTRRNFLTAAGVAAQATRALPAATDGPDLAKLVSRADLVYDRPAPRSEEGIPIGNGRMGTLAWTSPTQLRMQINHADVYGNNSATNSFFERNQDYCGGCAFVDLDFGIAGDEPFPESGFPQRLSVYDGVLTVEGKGVVLRVFAWPAEDVIAIEVETQRAATVALRMLRPAVVHRFSHTATSKLLADGTRIALTQEFKEGDFCCQSAVAIAVAGRAAHPRLRNETEAEIAAAGAGAFAILISSAATFDSKQDVGAVALRTLDAAQSKGGAALARESREWWHDFWSRAGFVQLHSEDGAADYVEQNYTYFLYVMASSSRGKLPPKFNGMVWNTQGDFRTWGSMHWFANLSCYYEALPATGRWELMDPMFEMYSGMLPACSVAARQQWGSQGMYIPETVYFDGLEKLPDDIAAEMRDLYLRRKPWEQRSAAFMEYARTKHPHSSRWNWIQSAKWENGRYLITERGFGPYGAVTHIFGTTAKVAYLYWRRYEYALDREWLRTRAWPMLRAAAEFYRNHPNVTKGEDGKYHIHWANSNESVYGARDTDEDLSAMRGIFAALLRASEILDAEASMRPVWREFLDNLAPLPVSDEPDALKADNYNGPRVYVRGRKPAVKPAGTLPDGNSLPMWFFDLCNLESHNQVAEATFQQALRGPVTAQTPVSVLSKQAIAAASIGRADAVRFMIPNQMRVLSPERSSAYKGGAVLANRMTLREGPQALDAQRLGRAAEALHLALLQSNPPAPGEDPILHLFPAWPKEWDARFTLYARGGFRVSASIVKARIESLEIESLSGAECRLRNPFDRAVTLHRDGRTAETLTGSLLRFPTRKGEKIGVTG